MTSTSLWNNEKGTSSSKSLINSRIWKFSLRMKKMRKFSMLSSITDETELAVIKARSDYFDRPDLILRRIFLETEINRRKGFQPVRVQPGIFLKLYLI